MSCLKVFTLDQANEWDKIVKSFKNHDVYYVSNYSRAFQLIGDGEPLLFYYDSDNLRAINVVMKRDVASAPCFKDIIQSNEWYDFSTPYGYGGFLLEGSYKPEDIIRLDQEYSSYCINNNIVSEFVRFSPVLNNAAACSSLYDVVDLGFTVSMDLSSKELIWNNISSKNRNVIRKAQKENVEIFCGRSKELFKHFIEMYNQTMERDNAHSYYFFKPEFYDSILYDLKNNSLIFYAQLNNEIIAMSVILFFNNRMHYHLSASKSGYLKYAPTNLLLYEAACWGSDNGYQSLHLGGGIGSHMDGLYKFKKAFNRNADCQFSIGKKIFNSEKYNELCQANANLNTDFFPAYRG